MSYIIKKLALDIKQTRKQILERLKYYVIFNMVLGMDNIAIADFVEMIDLDPQFDKKISKKERYEQLNYYLNTLLNRLDYNLQYSKRRFINFEQKMKTTDIINNDDLQTLIKKAISYLQKEHLLFLNYLFPEEGKTTFTPEQYEKMRTRYIIKQCAKSPTILPPTPLLPSTYSLPSIPPSIPLSSLPPTPPTIPLSSLPPTLQLPRNDKIVRGSITDELNNIIPLKKVDIIDKNINTKTPLESDGIPPPEILVKRIESLNKIDDTSQNLLQKSLSGSETYSAHGITSSALDARKKLLSPVKFTPKNTSDPSTKTLSELLSEQLNERRRLLEDDDDNNKKTTNSNDWGGGGIFKYKADKYKKKYLDLKKKLKK